MKKKPAKRKSTVNAAGNYTKPAMRKRLFRKSRLVARVAVPGSGLLVRLRCWLNSTKLLAGV